MHCLGHWQLGLRVDANGRANQDQRLVRDLYWEIILIPKVSLLRKVMLTSAIQLESILTCFFGHWLLHFPSRPPGESPPIPEIPHRNRSLLCHCQSQTWQSSCYHEAFLGVL